MAVNTTQGIVLAIFGANAGGHLTSLDANATANGNASLATDLSAAAGLILGVDLSTDAAFTSTVLSNLGIAEDSAGYTLASNYFTTNLAAGSGRGDLVAAAVEYLLGSSVDASLTDSATAFSASVTAGVEYSQGAGATVFGVSDLRTAAGSTTAGEGQTFTLTTDDDSMVGTSGNDTFTAASGTLSADDSITDSVTTDSDVLNVTASSAVAMDVSNVESINIDWDGYATPTYDLSDVSGATVAVSSTKQGYLGSANFDSAGSNNITFGAGVTGTATVDGNEDSTITNTAAETLTIGSGAEGDGAVVVLAAAAETVSVTGGDTITVTAASADDITVTGTANLADEITVNAGVDADLTVKGAADAIVNLNSDADITLTIAANGATNYETINLGGTGAIELDINETLGNLATEFAVNNGGVVTLGGALGSADLSLVTHTDLRLEDTTAGATINLQNGANVTLEATLASGTTKFETTDDYDTSADVLTLTLEDEQDAGTTVIDVNGASSENDFETLNLVIDPNSSFVKTADFDIDSIVGDNAETKGSGTMVNVTSADSDVEVTIAAIVAKEVDGSLVTGELELTNAGAADEDMTVIAAAGATTVNFQSENNDTTFISGNSADDTVSFDTTIGTAVAQFAGGENTVTMDGTLAAAGTIAVVGGTGADDVTISAAAVGTISLLLGDGDNVIDLANLGATAEASVVLGAGDDEVSIDTGTAGAEATIDFGTGSNTLKPDAEADLTDMTLTLSNLDKIELSASTSAADTDAIFKSSTLTGQSYEILGNGVTAGALVDELGVEIVDGAGSFDASSLVISDGLTDGVEGLVVTFADADENKDTTVTLTTGADEITLTAAGTNGDMTIDGGDGNDTITSGDGDDVLTGGKGNDTIDSADGDDTITGGAGFDALTAGGGDDVFIINDDDATNIADVTITAAGANFADSDTVAFTFGEVDLITEFGDAGDDDLDFAETFSAVAAIATGNDLNVGEGAIGFVIGDWVGDANGNGSSDAGDFTFTVLAAGNDLLVAYDANGSSSTNDIELIALDGITSLTLANLI